MSTIVEPAVPAAPNLLGRARGPIENALLYIGGISDLGVQTIRENRFDDGAFEQTIPSWPIR